MVNLKELVSKPISGEWGDEGEGIKVLRTTNFKNNGVINFNNVVTRNVSINKIEQKKLIKGDIIIEKSGGSPTQPVGRVVFFDNEGDFICNNFTSILRPKKDKVIPKYLHYILFANHKFGITEMFQNKTTGIINLQLTRYLDKIKVPLPSLETQKRIAQILDDATTLRDRTELLLKECDALAQSIFVDMFGDPVRNPKGWDKERLGNLGVFKNGLNYSKSENGNKLKVIGIGDFKNLSEIKSFDHISYVEMNEFPKDNFLLKDEDLLFVRSNGNKELVGRCLMVFVGDKKVSYSGFTIRFRKNSTSLSNKYLVQLLQRAEFKKYIFKNGRGANIQNINQELLNKVEIQLPPIELQNQFSEKIALIELQKELAKQELIESQDLFNCLLQKAFKGELV